MKISMWPFFREMYFSVNVIARIWPIPASLVSNYRTTYTDQMRAHAGKTWILKG